MRSRHRGLGVEINSHKWQAHLQVEMQPSIVFPKNIFTALALSLGPHMKVERYIDLAATMKKPLHGELYFVIRASE